MSEFSFEAAPAAKSVKYPRMKQLGTGAKPKPVTYAPGTDDEVTLPKCPGRLVIFKPVAGSLEKNVPSRFKGAGPQDRMKVDVTVLDGDPITAVIDKDGDEIYTFPEPLVPGFVLPGMFVSHTLLTGKGGQLLDAYESGGMILGRIMQLPPKIQGGNKAWAIGNYSDADLKIAREWIEKNPPVDPLA